MPARVISHYRIVRRLGAGGMGEVFLAQDTELGRPVALKLMSVELARDPEQRKRFRMEARAASGLAHSHICIIYEVGETEDERPFMAMEYIEGRSLDALLQKQRLTIPQIIQLGIDVAEALDAAHERGLVHRDIKPANLMLNSRGEVKVMDFGLAKQVVSDELTAPVTTVAKTQPGMVIGTPQYMSPEQTLGWKLDHRADLFSLGTVLYELLAGQRPFVGKTVWEMMNSIVNERPAPLDLGNPRYSPALENIVFKCLQKDRDRRYGSAKELAADLRKLKEDSERGLAAATQPTKTATTEGNETRPTALWKLSSKALRQRYTALGWVLGMTLIAAAVWGGWILLRRSSARAPAPSMALALAQSKSVAVLPFVNLSADKADEYLSDGMTEELLNALTRIPGLRVPGRSSSFAFKGKTDENIFRKVGDQLGVGAVLEGSVRKAGNQLRVTAQLINVADGFHLWSDTYDRDMTNIFAIQSDIAARVAAALKVQLLGGVREPTGNIEAYKLYLQGRYLWNRRTGESIRQAIDFFNQAIAKDPRYALAYEGLANCYALLPIYARDASADALARTRAAALTAMELDNRLAGPVAALAALKDGYEWDWEGAEADYRRAIALDGNYATARQWLAESLSMRGRSEEAIQQARQAVELDPLAPMINTVLARVLLTAGKTEESMAVLHRQIAWDPSFAPAHAMLGWAFIAQGKLPQAVAEYETVSRLDENNPRGELGFCYARIGKTEAAKEQLQKLQDGQRTGHDVRVEIAVVHHGLGDDKQAFASLERAVAEHSSQLQTVIENPCWKDVRSHPRFQAILKQMHLVQ